MRKLLAVVLTLSLVVAFAGFALAEEGTTPTVTATTYTTVTNTTVTDATYNNTVTDTTYNANSVTGTIYSQPAVCMAVYTYAGVVTYNKDGVFTVAKLNKNVTMSKSFTVPDPAVVKVTGIKGLKIFTLVEKKVGKKTISVPKFVKYTVKDLASIPVGAKVVVKYDARGTLKEVKVVGGIVNKKEMQDLMKMKRDTTKTVAALKAKVQAEIKAKVQAGKAKK
ncbi:hypothetical protein [Carboxydothermus ferrireducens]|uniref:Uncharacterized protein n=1 Tax=Carboxydothermus ferrireducens DSM 11255 TaxID=1119529 RepID=A0ABX2RB36_9THEO|nr:hypothetical protein [Carboxydothermus ferrireducens]NYE57817.1 hypothetical protein [Carboxydothermus ferrireducens DSM 11255]